MRTNLNPVILTDVMLKKMNTARLLKVFQKTRKLVNLSEYSGCGNWLSPEELTVQLNRYREELNKREHVKR